MFKLTTFIAAAIGCAVSIGAANADDYNLPIKEHILDNGLKLLVLERPGDPRVASKIYTDMGALNEIPGEYGSAHFLEHLMFKGTPTLGTSNWAAEKPLIMQQRALEEQLTEALNKARNDIRQRGVFHDYKHKVTTPEIEDLRQKMAALDEKINQYGIEGTTMKWYQAVGGTNLTAQTEAEYMHFDINLPVSKVEMFLRIEADRMQNTIFRRFDQERMILVEQRYGDLSRNITPYKEAMDALTAETSMAFVPEGYKSDFEKYTRKFQRYLYETYFVPNNTTLIFVGGVTMDQMMPMVEKYFGHMKRTPEPMRYYGEEPTPSYEKRLIYRTNKISPRVEVRFMMPGVGHPDRPHFEVIGNVVVEELQAALDAAKISATASFNTRVVHTDRFGVPASINFEVVGRQQDLDKIEAVMLQTFSEVAKTGSSVHNISWAQKKLRAEWHRLAADSNDLANEIGHFEVMDSWKMMKDYLLTRDTTSRADVQRLMSRYFIANNRSVGFVKAEEGDE